MNSLLLPILIFSNSIGRDVPSDVRCIDARTGISPGPGAYLDAAEALAVVQLAESYERGCADKVLDLAAHRDEQESAAVTTAGAASAVGGFAAGSGLLAFLRRKRVAKAPPPVAS